MNVSNSKDKRSKIEAVKKGGAKGQVKGLKAVTGWNNKQGTYFTSCVLNAQGNVQVSGRSEKKKLHWSR